MLVSFTFKSAAGRIIKEHKLDIRSTQATGEAAPELAGQAFEAARLSYYERQAVQEVIVNGIGTKPLTFKKDSFMAPLL